MCIGHSENEVFGRKDPGFQKKVIRKLLAEAARGVETFKGTLKYLILGTLRFRVGVKVLLNRNLDIEGVNGIGFIGNGTDNSHQKCVHE